MAKGSLVWRAVPIGKKLSSKAVNMPSTMIPRTYDIAQTMVVPTADTILYIYTLQCSAIHDKSETSQGAGS